MKKQDRSEISSISIGAAVGAGGSVIVTLMLSVLSASLVGREILPETSIDALTVGVLILSSMCGSLIGYAVTGHHRLPVCLTTGGGYYLLLLASTALFFGGEYRAVGVTALAILGGSGAMVLLGLKEGKRGRRSRYVKNRNWKVVQN